VPLIVGTGSRIETGRVELVRVGFANRFTMGILLWAVFGLIAGAIAKFLMPGKAPGGVSA